MMYRFAAGGLENVLVQLINGLPRQAFRHTIIALTSADREFAARIERDDVNIVEMGKPPGQPFRLYPRMYRLLRELRPDVLHTCNLAALEFVPVAALARVPRRVHAEHGWDVADLEGNNRRFRLLRRLYRPFVNEFVAVSGQLHGYLRDAIGVHPSRLHLVANGVDTGRFRPRRADDQAPGGFPFSRPEHWVVGTVGRLEPVKNQALLARAFVRMVQARPPGAERLRLAIVGGGPGAEEVAAPLIQAGLGERLWMPGVRRDVPEILRSLDCFVLPSLSEGTSCTLQEAMATELPIIATNVGGNANLLEQGRCGTLVASQDEEGMARALAGCFLGQAAAAAQGAEGLRVAHEKYALSSMMGRYEQLFQGQ
jgi:sugar transferase (PEP-CTERM/EpsH1 system associated)